MKLSRFTKAIAIFSVVGACCFGLAACSNGGNDAASNAVAATVNGVEIKEQKVTDQIESIRTQSNLQEEEAWGKFLVENEMTPSSVRDQILDSLIQQEVLKAGAAELGVSVEDSEVDDYVNQMKGNYDNDEAWASALEQAGFSEQEYRDTIKDSLLQRKVREHFDSQEENTEASNDELIEKANVYKSSYDGSKRSSHILFKVEDKSDENAMNEARKKAEKVLKEIKKGKDFAEAAKENSEDTSAENGGDVGWDKLNSFVNEYTDALNQLEADQISDVVESEYGFHIIKCTEVWHAPEGDITSLDQLPSEFVDDLKDKVSSSKSGDAYQNWLDERKENSDIQKNDMPQGLPYDIDLTKYQEEADQEDNPDGEAIEETKDDAEATEAESEGEEADTANTDANAETTNTENDENKAAE